MARRFDSIANLVESTPEGRKYLRNVIYPEIGLSDEDIYVIATGGDRYDKLSLQFYNTIDYWWIIAVANTDTLDSLAISPGAQIRIPADPLYWHSVFENINGIV